MKKFRFNQESQDKLKDAFQKLENSALSGVVENVIGGARVHGQTFSESGGHGQTHSQSGHSQTHSQTRN